MVRRNVVGDIALVDVKSNNEEIIIGFLCQSNLGLMLFEDPNGSVLFDSELLIEAQLNEIRAGFTQVMESIVNIEFYVEYAQGKVLKLDVRFFEFNSTKN